VKHLTFQVEAFGAPSATMRRRITIKMLTSSSLGVLWSPLLSTLQDFDGQEGSMDRISSVLDARTLWRPMTADVCRVKLCTGSWMTAALASRISGTRRLSKLKTHSRGCACALFVSVGVRKDVKRSSSSLVEGEYTPGARPSVL